MNCPECNQPNTANARFCQNCGAALLPINEGAHVHGFAIDAPGGIINIGTTTATPPGNPHIGECPICGGHKPPEQTFRCKKCQRDSICLEHRDAEFFWCSDCRQTRNVTHGQHNNGRKAVLNTDNKTLRVILIVTAVLVSGIFAIVLYTHGKTFEPTPTLVNTVETTNIHAAAITSALDQTGGFLPTKHVMTKALTIPPTPTPKPITTFTLMPTETPLPTFTPSKTSTPTSTSTPTPTSTKIPSLTPAPTVEAISTSESLGAQTSVLGMHVVSDEPGKLSVDVDYSYDGTYGTEGVNIMCYLSKTTATGFWFTSQSSTGGVVHLGTGTTRCDLNAGGLTSDEIMICFATNNGGTMNPFLQQYGEHCKTFLYHKVW